MSCNNNCTFNRYIGVRYGMFLKTRYPTIQPFVTQQISVDSYQIIRYVLITRDKVSAMKQSFLPCENFTNPFLICSPTNLTVDKSVTLVTYIRGQFVFSPKNDQNHIQREHKQLLFELNSFSFVVILKVQFNKLQ